MLLAQQVTSVLSVLTLIGQVILIVLIAAYFNASVRKLLLPIIPNRLFLFSFVVALVATMGSLFFSEIAGYEPCKLCWFQRIFMYPQVVLFGMGMDRKDKNVFGYAMVLSGIGALIAGYHYLLQRGLVNEIVPCSTVGYSISCTDKFVMELGYITIPLMSLTAFLLLFALALVYKKSVHSRQTR
ncbi:disulfide bond formation protein B [Candidatus Roizmanbacteria bacterium]|nr:disulfide bond formation protein B [Candidatus Roizmanbacteria bacterium]